MFRTIGRRDLADWLPALAVCAAVSCTAHAAARASEPSAPAAAAEAQVDFAADVAPLLVERCLACHQGTGAKGGFDMSQAHTALAGGESGSSIVPGKPEESWLLDLIDSSAGRPQMPQDGTPLSAEQIALLRQWIVGGAVWPAEMELRHKPKADASWWSLQPLHAVEPPAAEGAPGSWAAHPIDRFIHARLRAEGLAPSPPADRRTLIRRATYDLLGLPPTPDEVAEFVGDSSPDAYPRLIDRLLASPHYGERWGRHWLDVVRFGESTGFERNTIIDNGWPFRDYVIRSLNDDKPFDQFFVEHLAGDVVAPGDAQVEVGTTFLVAGPYDNVNNADPVQKLQIRNNTLDDMITAVGSAFLGLTVHCARCHDHKFDPITQADYYRLHAALAGVEHGQRVLVPAAVLAERNSRLAPLEARRKDLLAEIGSLEKRLLAEEQQQYASQPRQYRLPPVSTHLTEDVFEPLVARYVRLRVLSGSISPDSIGNVRIDEFEVFTAEDSPRNVALVAAGATTASASRIAEDFATAYAATNAIDGRYDTAWHVGNPPELVIELGRAERIGRIAFSSDRQQVLPERNRNRPFVGEYTIEVSLDGSTWTRVADSLERAPLDAGYARQRVLEHLGEASWRSELQSLRKSLSDVEAQLRRDPLPPPVWSGTFRQPEQPSRVLAGGDPLRPGDAVAAGSLGLLEAAAGRYQLPLDAPEAERRLALARWLVAEGNPLTARVLANRVWQYHFGTGVVDTPNDFGYLGSRPTHPELLNWLALRLKQHGWRLKPLHREIMLSQSYQQSSSWRAEAAAVDSLSRLLWRFPPRRLSAEELRDTLLAVSDRLDRRMGGRGFRLYRYLQDNVSTYVPLDTPGAETYRRAVYHQNARAARVDLLAQFDCPDSALSAPVRSSTTTPLQALTLLNHRFSLDMAEALAERLQNEAGAGNTAAQVERAFLLAFSRPPADNELRAAADLIEQHGLATFCRAIWNLNELVYLD